MLKRTLIALAFVLPLAACAGKDATLTPRQQANQIESAYNGAQVIALHAIQSGLLSDDVEARIKLAEKAATAAVIAYGDAATRCERNAAGVIVDDDQNPPGVHCDQSLIGLTSGAAKALIDNLNGLLAAAGVTG